MSQNLKLNRKLFQFEHLGKNSYAKFYKFSVYIEYLLFLFQLLYSLLKSARVGDKDIVMIYGKRKNT